MILVRLFRGLADETRLRMVHLLRRSPLCVSHLQVLLGSTQVTVSKQLRYLRRLGLVEKGVYRNFRIYRLRSDLPTEAIVVLDAIEGTSNQVEVLKGDLDRLEAMSGQVSSVVSRTVSETPGTGPASVVDDPAAGHAPPGLAVGVEYVD